MNLVQRLPHFSELQSNLRAGRFDLAAMIDAVCNRIDAIEPELQALLDEPARCRRLLTEAAALQQRYPAPAARPPLYGVLVGVKDIFRVDGFPTRVGSQLPAEIFAGAEADAVRALRQAGALILGKTVTTEFAFFEPGPTRNPHNPAHTPGGSSSGSAAAVAAGYCPLALGTQTIGSVLRPAAFCGIVGFKPSFGRVSTAGVIPFSDSLDHVGWLAQDVAGVAAASAVLCRDWRPAPARPARPTLGVPSGPYLEQAPASTLSAFEAMLSRLAAAGYSVRHVPALSDIAAINRRHVRIMAAEVARVHADWFPRYQALYRPRTAALIREGYTVTDEELQQARAGRLTLRDELHTRMDAAGIDLWVCPPTLGPAPAGLASTGDPIMNLPWTHAGLPALTLPAGRADNGLPLGLQVIARFGADETLLAWAAGMESVLAAG
jgi:Asp-tRNA(Asn)/Glu-tRNA(Gln) amidotransferase A subunit family amidase